MAIKPCFLFCFLAASPPGPGMLICRRHLPSRYLAIVVALPLSQWRVPVRFALFYGCAAGPVATAGPVGQTTVFAASCTLPSESNATEGGRSTASFLRFALSLFPRS